jgi:hypothetical protein
MVSGIELIRACPFFEVEIKGGLLLRVTKTAASTRRETKSRTRLRAHTSVSSNERQPQQSKSSLLVLLDNGDGFVSSEGA